MVSTNINIIWLRNRRFLRERGYAIKAVITREIAVPIIVINAEFSIARVMLSEAKTYCIVSNVKCFGNRRKGLFITSEADAKEQATICQKGRSDTSVKMPRIE